MDAYKQCDILFRLGELQISYNRIPDKLWKKMLKDLTIKIEKNLLPPYGLFKLMEGLKGMKVTWSQLSKKIQSSIIDQLIYRLKKAPMSTNITTLSNLFELGFNWNEDLIDEQRRKIIAGVQITLPELTNEQFLGVFER